MKWPTDYKDIRDVKAVADVIDKWTGNNVIDVAKIVDWCVRRYRPSPDMTSMNIDHEEADLKAALEAGILPGSNEMALIQTGDELLSDLCADVFMSLGGGEWAHFCAGLVVMRNGYSEATTPIKDTDEDKRAAVMLKKVELHTKLKPLMLYLKEYSDNAFKEPTGPVKSGFRKFMKAAPGTEKDDMEGGDD